MRRAAIVQTCAVAIVLAALVATCAWWAGEARRHARVTASAPSVEDVGSITAPFASDGRSDPSAFDASLGAKTAAAPHVLLDESTLMARLRAVKDVDPATAVALAREGNGRFPDSPHAAERSSILIHALAAEGLASEARGEAEDMVNRYPDSAWIREVEIFTGAHRHRSVRLSEAGTLEYY